MRHALLRVLPLLLLLPYAPAVAGEGAEADGLKALTNEGLSLMKARISVQGKESPVERDLRFTRVESGKDSTGRFDLFHYALQPSAPEATSSLPPIEGELQLKRYYTGGVTLASLDYQGPMLASKNSLQVTMHLPRFARGMAIQRDTGPSFASDYRLLPDSNVIVLWQQLEDDDYQVLVPLSGDGMGGEVGKHDLRFGVTLSGQAPSTPHHVPLFAFATGDDPYRLTQDAYKAAFADSHFDGRLRQEKPYPEVFRSFGWSAGNASDARVTEEDLLRSAKSLKAKKLPVGFMLLDDGRLSARHGLDWLTSTLRWEYDIPLVGTWQALQGGESRPLDWPYSNLVRTSSDVVPEEPWTNKEHVFQNAYNSFWASNFAYPDFAMFQSHLPQAEYQAIARAVSGGPVYVSDEAGKENAELLNRLMLSSGRLLMLDGPGRVTRDTLLVDTGLVPVPLKMAGSIRRPGLTAGMVGAFNVNKSAAEVVGSLHPADIGGLEGSAWAVYEQSSGRLKVLDGKQELPIRLGEYGAELYTVVPIEDRLAVLGLLDKYLGPAAVQEVRREGREVEITLEEPGEFGAYVKSWPKSVRVGDRVLSTGGYRYRNHLLRIPRTSFRAGEDPVVRMTL